MKRLFSFLLAMAMVLSLGVTAFATEIPDPGTDPNAGTPTGTITITNATIDQTYRLFKFFDADYATITVDGKEQVVTDENGKAVVSYTLAPGDTNRVYYEMFGKAGAQGTTYFNYNIDTHVVTKKATDGDIITYLGGLIQNLDPTGTPITATSETVTFTGLTPGYYLVDRGMDSTVTITTNMPDISIIDKNQIPGSGFDKDIVESSGVSTDSNSASVGDVIKYEVTFTATNYDGDKPVQYYTIKDHKSSPLWVEFKSIEVVILDKDTNGDSIYSKEEGTKLTRGYYFFGGNTNSPAETNEWKDHLGDWGDTPKTPENAQWFMIHKDYDNFEIIIPWLENHNFICDKDKNTYSLEYATPLPKHLYKATTDVVVTYTAALGADAPGGVSVNEAYLKWKTDKEYGPTRPSTTETRTYNLGVTKTADDKDESRLGGAVFELYRSYNKETKELSDPVYVIPTNNTGVYILDDVATEISGGKRKTARELYRGYWEDYLNTRDATDATQKGTEMTTPEGTGQIIVLGLEEGTYYLVEKHAPSGYNKLADPIAVTVSGENTTPYDNDYKELVDPTQEVTYEVTHVPVENNRGMQLPSTGGEGRMMLITIGSMIAMGFAVLLITQKKMSIYKD